MTERPDCRHCKAVAAAMAADPEGREARALIFSTAGIGDCPCVCHLPARIAGALPRLKAVTA